ncbi:MAG: hypothetical protein IPM63_16995 [Acidobacteriota bacterium]|nr:MAG: hypothetical protein IPM63_16995 [Acidobacteriota bacterium]
MQHLPKNGGKKKSSDADDAKPRSNRESGPHDEEPEPSRSYYYDDAYGYEDYKPAEDEEAEKEDKTPGF